MSGLQLFALGDDKIISGAAHSTLSGLTSVSTSVIKGIGSTLSLGTVSGAAAADDLMTIDGTNGNVGIATNSPSEKLYVNGNIKIPSGSGYSVKYGNDWYIYGSDSGSLYFGLNNEHGYATQLQRSGSFYSPSDDRLKHNETAIVNALDTINLLNPINYDMTEEFLDADFNGNLDELGISHTKQTGFIAQDVKNIPELADCVVEGSSTEPFILGYDKIYVYAVKAIQELKIKNDNLESLNTNLQNDLTEEKAKTLTLETQMADLLARVTALENP